jgi:hypothetical protein
MIKDKVETRTFDSMEELTKFLNENFGFPLLGEDIELVQMEEE